MKVVENTRYEVLTEQGWKDFKGIKKVEAESYFELTFSDGSNLKCTHGHLIALESGDFVSAFDIDIGALTTSNLTLVSKSEVKESADVYDLLEVKDTESYITNGVTSHNCAFVNKWDEFAASVLPTLSSGKETITIFTSTPNGMNHFYRYVEGARAGTNGYYYIEVPWHAVPGRDEEWKQEVLQSINFDMEKFYQEYECSFIGSSGTLISGSMLKLLEPKTPIFKNHEIRQYEEAQENHVYAICVDVSRGKGIDYSAFHVIDVSVVPMQQVCVYHCNTVSPTDYATIVYSLAKSYNQAHVLVEVNDIGGQVADLLHEEYEYENIIYTESGGRGGAKVSGGFGGNVTRGLRTTKTTKKIGCAVLKLLIEQKKLEIHDKETIEELNRFSKKGDSYEAEENAHDDLVMGLVIFAWLSQDKFFNEITDVDTMKLFRERTDEEYEADLAPFGFIRNGIDEFEEVVVDTNGELWDGRSSLGSW